MVSKGSLKTSEVCVRKWRRGMRRKLEQRIKEPVGMQNLSISKKMKRRMLDRFRSK